MNKVKEFFMWTGVGVAIFWTMWGLISLIHYGYSLLPYQITESGKETIMITIMCVLVGHMAKWICEVNNASKGGSCD